MKSTTGRDDARASRRSESARLTEAKAANETLGRDREALAALATRRNAAVDVVSEAVAAHADLEGEARSLKRQMDLQRENWGRTEARLRSREDALKAITNELTTLQQRDAGGDEELSKLRTELQALRAETEPAQGELDHLVSRQRTMREQLAGATTKLLATERAFLEVESAVKLRGDELAALRGTIEARTIVSRGATSFRRRSSRSRPCLRRGDCLPSWAAPRSTRRRCERAACSFDSRYGRWGR